MLHLDEGAIHGWLDGALSADEAARVESHLDECPECAARVAEARGLIAASSRILTALDSVPNRVLPQAPGVKARNWVVWRAAAAVAVVAVGTLVVTRGSTRISNRIATASPAASTSARLPASAIQTEATEAVTVPSAESKAGAQKGHSALAKAPESQALAGAAGAVRQPFASVQSAPIALDAAIAQASLRIVGSPSIIGETRTLYEVSPGDTVLLAESESVASNAVGATVRAGAAPQAQRKMSVPASIPSADAPISSNLGGPGGVNTIIWTDITSGKLMKLSGHHSRAELEDIRRRIEQARAAGLVKPKAR